MVWKRALMHFPEVCTFHGAHCQIVGKGSFSVDRTVDMQAFVNDVNGILFV